jgi:hypothetical protein
MVTAGASTALVVFPSHCIGSDCMAWCWYKRTIGEAESGAGRGYCGKAGVPTSE